MVTADPGPDGVPAGDCGHPGRPGAPRAVRQAAGAVAVEGFALVALGLFDIGKTVTGKPHSVVFAVIGALMAVGTGAVLMLLARGLWRQSGWARSPVVVLQLLALPVGFSLVQAGLWLYGGPILLLALGVLYLLATPEARLAFHSE